MTVKTHFSGGPFDGSTRLGRVRPDMVSGGPGRATDSGPEVLPQPVHGGEYRRTSPDDAPTDEYVWHLPDMGAVTDAALAEITAERGDQ